MASFLLLAACRDNDGSAVADMPVETAILSPSELEAQAETQWALLR